MVKRATEVLGWDQSARGRSTKTEQARGVSVSGTGPIGFVRDVFGTIMDRFQRPRAGSAPNDIGFDVTMQSFNRTGSFTSGERVFPYPQVIGAVSGFFPMQDNLSMQWAYGRPGFGPGFATPVPAAWQITYPGLKKVTG